MYPETMPPAEYKGTKIDQIPYPNPSLTTTCLFLVFGWGSFTRRGIGRALIKRLVHDLKERAILPNLKVEGI